MATQYPSFHFIKLPHRDAIIITREFSDTMEEFYDTLARLVREPADNE
jgi:hypothetical protein